MPRRHHSIERPRKTQVWRKTPKNEAAFNRMVSAFRNAGFNDYDISGIIGNFIQESGCNFDMFTKDRKGYAHMTTDQYNKMKQLYKDELDYYVDWATGNVDKKHSKDLGYLQGRFKPGRSKSAEQAAYDFVSLFERPVIKGVDGSNMRHANGSLMYQNELERKQFAGDVYQQLIRDHIDNYYEKHIQDRLKDQSYEIPDATTVNRNIQMPIHPYDDPSIPNAIEATGAMQRQLNLTPKYDINKVIQPFGQPQFQPTTNDEGFDDGKNPNVYTAKKGDSLWRISRRYTGRGARYKELLETNNIKDPNFIRIGQNIVLPESWMKPVKKEKEQQAKETKTAIAQEQRATDRIHKPEPKPQIKAKPIDKTYLRQPTKQDDYDAFVDLPEVVITNSKEQRAKDIDPVYLRQPEQKQYSNVQWSDIKQPQLPYRNVESIAKANEQNNSHRDTTPKVEYSYNRKPTKDKVQTTPEIQEKADNTSWWDKHIAPIGQEMKRKAKEEDQRRARELKKNREKLAIKLENTLGQDVGDVAYKAMTGDIKGVVNMAKNYYGRHYNDSKEQESNTIDLKQIAQKPQIKKPEVSKKEQIKKPVEKKIDQDVINEQIANTSYESPDTRYWKNDPGANDNVGGKFYKKRSIRLTDDMRFGVRSRGDVKDLNSNDAMIPLLDNDGEAKGTRQRFWTYDQVIQKGVHTWKDYMKKREFIGISKEGKLKIGDISKFGKGDMMKVISYVDVDNLPMTKKGNLMYRTAKGNESRSEIIITGDGQSPGLLTARRKDTGGKASGKYYGNVAGGTMILKCGDEIRLVSGTIEDIAAAHRTMRENHKGKLVRWYRVDNGSYNRGLRTQGRNISKQDLIDYDSQNSAGGNFIYRLNK